MTRKRNTLLHFITGMADPISTRQFQNILAAGDSLKGLKEKMDKYYKQYEKGPIFKDVDTDSGNFIQRGLKKAFIGVPRGINKAIRESKGLHIDPLDLSPEE